MDWTNQHEAALGQLNLLLSSDKNLTDARLTLQVMGLDKEFLDTVVQRHQEIAAGVIEVPTGSSVDSGTLNPWYTGVQPTHKFWPALRESLSSDPKWKEAVQSLDDTSKDVVARLGNPQDSTFATRGLVLGYVQSGKTANFTATIAKAADAGYRLFIVLSGVHNSLRRQTQLRLENQIVDLSPVNWIGLTSEDADFGNPVQALPLLEGSKLRLLAVVKKNVTRLSNLVNWLSTAQKHGALDNCPILIIDDEADQASINTAKDAELDATAIHSKLKELLSLPKVSYLGYTATPFANVLANPKDSLGVYPRDFIYSLPKPPNYFGAQELFGAAVVEDEENDSNTGHNMIRYVNEEEASGYVVKSKQSYSPLVSPSLAAAVRWFIMSTAARRARSNEIAHSSMLVHTTMRVQPQLDFVPVIKKFIKSLAAEWSSGNVEMWRQQWIEETALEPSSKHGLRHVSFEEMSTVVNDVLAKVHVIADNSYSEDRLIYSDEPATVIAVGGNTLSRGLTLEGLISSFFLRSSSMYDSALQMGRWFGYRTGYSDLPRIWTTRGLASNFEFLSTVESSIREDIARYGNNGLTPKQLAVRLLLHPKMQATSKLKMQFAVPVTASFSDSRPQTILFNHRTDSTVSENFSAAKKLLFLISTPNNSSGKTGPLVIRNVSSTTVLDFLSEYSFHEESEMSGGLLTDYVRRQVEFGKLTEWNVAVMSNRTPAYKDSQPIDFGTNRLFNPVNRSKIKTGNSDTAYLKSITSASDYRIDFTPEINSIPDVVAARNAMGKPLLLIYPIAKDSVPGPQANQPGSSAERVPLDAIDTLIGVAFSLPCAAQGSEPDDMVHVDLKTVKREEIGEEIEDVSYADREKSLDKVSFDG